MRQPALPGVHVVLPFSDVFDLLPEKRRIPFAGSIGIAERNNDANGFPGTSGIRLRGILPPERHGGQQDRKTDETACDAFQYVPDTHHRSTSSIVIVSSSGAVILMTIFMRISEDSGSIS